MPANFVVRTGGPGNLQQVQVGPADLVATLTAAHSAWGWLGGLTGIQNFFKFCYNADEQKKLERRFKEIKFAPPSCHVLTQSGLQTLPFADQGAFGDNLSTKIVGLTLCALNYNFRLDDAIEILMEYFIDPLFEKGLSDLPGSKQALRGLITDNVQVILNEGATRYLPEAFDTAIAALPIMSAQSTAKDVRYPESITEGHMIRGFLEWLTGDSRESYYTRSALVTRIACCLKTVGYIIDEIVIWDGSGRRPVQPNSLFLVIGGTQETDHLMHDQRSHIGRVDRISHYRWETVGAMLWNTVAQPSEHVHETFQQDFERTDAAVSRCLDIRWADEDEELGEIQVFPVWRKPAPLSSRIAIRLAAYYFTDSVDHIAPFYESIANERYLKAIQSSMKGPRPDRTGKEIQRFQTMSASICLAVLAQLAGPSFRTLQHLIAVDLCLVQDGDLKWLCNEVDAILNGGCTFSRVVKAVATIHCGRAIPASIMQLSSHDVDLDSSDESDSSTEIVNWRHSTHVIGWRKGRYAVLPELLFRLEKPVSLTSLQTYRQDETAQLGVLLMSAMAANSAMNLSRKQS